MSLLGNFEVNIYFKCRILMHNINVLDELNDNIIGIDFMHLHKLQFDDQNHQVKILNSDSDKIVAITKFVVPALSSTVLNLKYKGKVFPVTQYIANIYAPSNPSLSGMPEIVNVDKNKNCKIIIDNCAPDEEVTIARNNTLSINNIEPETLIPIEDSVISSILSEIHNKLPKVPKKNFAYKRGHCTKCASQSAK
jgi:hypothetical protein